MSRAARGRQERRHSRTCVSVSDSEKVLPQISQAYGRSPETRDRKISKIA